MRKDRDLVRGVEARNRQRNRNRSSGEARQAANFSLKELQKRVKQQVRRTRADELTKKNDLLVKHKRSSPKSYWNLLKQIVGLGKRKNDIPNEAVMDGVVVHGDQVLETWQKAFQKLGSTDVNDVAFDNAFMTEIKEEISNVEDHDMDGNPDERNRPIELNEVVSAIQQLKSGKAAGIDGLVNELLKYGGDTISVALGGYAKRCSAWNAFRATGPEVFFSHCIKQVTPGYPITIEALHC